MKSKRKIKKMMHERIKNYLAGYVRSIKRAIVVGVTVIVTTTALTGCQEGTARIGTQPLSPDAHANREIVEKGKLRFENELIHQMKFNRRMGQDSYDGVAIPIFNIATY